MVAALGVFCLTDFPDRPAVLGGGGAGRVGIKRKEVLVEILSLLVVGAERGSASAVEGAGLTPDSSSSLDDSDSASSWVVQQANVVSDGFSALVL